MWCSRKVRKLHTLLLYQSGFSIISLSIPQCLLESHSELQNLIFLSYIQLEAKEPQTTLNTLITLKTLTTLKNVSFKNYFTFVLLYYGFVQKCYIKVFATAGGNYNPFI